MLPNIKEIINKHWQTLNMDSSFKEVFNSLQLMIAFRKNTILKRVMGTNTIRNNQISHTYTTATAGQCTTCYTILSLCCQQLLKITTSTQTRETFKIFHRVTCHSNYIIYLLECIMCKIHILESLKHNLISD